MASFDPTLALFKVIDLARTIHLGRVTSVIVMSQSYIDANPDALANFLKAFKEAVHFVGRNTKQANARFRQASQLPSLTDEVLAIAASVEPNLSAQAPGEVSIVLDKELVRGIQEASNFGFDEKLISKRFNTSQHIDMQYAEKAGKELEAQKYSFDVIAAK